MQSFNIYPISVRSALIITILIIGSCYSYLPVRFSKKIIHQSPNSSYLSKDIKEDRVQFDVISFERKGKGRNLLKGGRSYRIYLKKHFARSIGLSHVDKINNKGVEYAFKGRFKEAEILFLESIKENSEFVPAYNNLGIIFELFGYKDKAFYMYSKACLLEPQNEYFRRNLLYFHNKKNLE